MEHIKQNDAGCIKIVQDIGCFFRSCGLVAEYKTGKSLTAEEINKTWEWAKAAHRIDMNDNVVNSASIINRFLRLLGDEGCFYEIGTFQDGKLNYYPSVAPELRKGDAFIQKIKQGGKSVTHFRLVDKYGNLIEDPHSPAIAAKSIYYTIIYCYVPKEK